MSTTITVSHRHLFTKGDLLTGVGGRWGSVVVDVYDDRITTRSIRWYEALWSWTVVRYRRARSFVLSLYERA